jgi:hypothetical protein
MGRLMAGGVCGISASIPCAGQMAKPFGLGGLRFAQTPGNPLQVEFGTLPQTPKTKTLKRFGSASLPFFAFRFLRSKNLGNLFTPASLPARLRQQSPSVADYDIGFALCAKPVNRIFHHRSHAQHAPACFCGCPLCKPWFFFFIVKLCRVFKATSCRTCAFILLFCGSSLGL